jgi:hypothetical protein
VKNQRARKKSRTLLADKEVRLEEICFVWCVCKTWEEMFALLVEHKLVNGHALVPQKFLTQGEIGLGEWVKNHRKYRMKGTLLADKEARLEEIGFVWQVRTHNS